MYTVDSHMLNYAASLIQEMTQWQGPLQRIPKLPSPVDLSLLKIDLGPVLHAESWSFCLEPSHTSATLMCLLCLKYACQWSFQAFCCHGNATFLRSHKEPWRYQRPEQWKKTEGLEKLSCGSMQGFISALEMMMLE